MYKKDKKE